MSLPYALPSSYIDGDYTVATPIDLPSFSSPIPATSKQYVLKQEFVQFKNNFQPLAFNTPHIDYPTFVLVAESDLQDQTGGVVKWTRTYALTPDSYDDWETTSYNYIGYVGVIAAAGDTIVTNVSGRLRFPLRVESRIHHDFFLVGTGQTYTAAGQIPVIQAQAYRYWTAGHFWVDTDYVAGGPGFIGSTVPTRAPSATTALANDPGYDSYVANAAKYGFNSGVVNYVWTVNANGTASVVLQNDPNPGQIVAEDSTLVRWMGNIYQRSTRYVLAK